MTIPLKSTFSGLTVEAIINGAPVQLILDTGSATAILTKDAAERIGLNATKDGAIQIRDISGAKIVAQRALTKRTNLGRAWTRDEPVKVVELPKGYADGLLGISTLADWDVRIWPPPEKLTRSGALTERRVRY